MFVSRWKYMQAINRAHYWERYYQKQRDQAARDKVGYEKAIQKLTDAISELRDEIDDLTEELVSLSEELGRKDRLLQELYTHLDQAMALFNTAKKAKNAEE